MYTSATIFDGGLRPAATQTNEASLRLTASGGTSSQPLTIAGLTWQGSDFGIQSEGSGPQAYLLLEDVETAHNRRQGIFWNSIGGGAAPYAAPRADHLHCRGRQPRH